MPSKYPARNLTPEQVDRCLLILAEHGGDAARAREHIEQELGEGAAPAARTLRWWRTAKYVDRYHEIVNGLDRTRRDEKLVQGFREATQRSLSGIDGILNRFDPEELDQRDLPNAAKALATVAGIASQNTMLYEGRPTAIVETRNSDWYEQEAKRLGFVDSDADEIGIEDAEIVE